MFLSKKVVHGLSRHIGFDTKIHVPGAQNTKRYMMQIETCFIVFNLQV